jgi:hypothetical protein
MFWISEPFLSMEKNTGIDYEVMHGGLGIHVDCFISCFLQCDDSVHHDIVANYKNGGWSRP